MTAHVNSPDLSAGSLLRGTMDLLRAHPLPLLLPLVLLGLLTSGGDRGGPAKFDAEDPLVLIPWYAFLGVVGIAVFVLLILAHSAAWVMTTHTALGAARGGPVPDLGAAWRATSSQILAAIGTGVLVLLGTVIGLILLVAPGLIFIAGVFPWGAVLVAEKKAGIAAIGRAWELAAGHKMALFLVILAGLGASIVATILLDWIPVIGSALAGAAGGAVMAAWATAGALFYHRRTHATPTPPVVAAPAVL